MSSAKTATEHLAFAWNTHRVLSPNPAVGACLSPLSVASALGLLAAGAGGITRAELVAALTGDPEGDPWSHADLLTATSTLAQPPDGERPRLAVSNTLWTADEVRVNPAFVEELGRWPAGTVRPTSFAPDPETARNAINADVAETTRGLIPQLLNPGVVTADMLAALVNALYLRTGWRHAFPERDTAPRAFHTPHGIRDVATMRLTERLAHAAADGWQVVRLPAAGEVTVDVLLPDGELAGAEPDLDARRLGALLEAAEPRRVELHLPRIEVSARFRLDTGLGELGVRTAFSERADLSGISTDPPLRISAAVHQAVLRLDEQGLEGAAATAVMFVPLMAVPERERPVVVRVDRPFLLLVRHARTGGVLFLARVVDPGG
ncbi:serine protease [Longimycelium tulufanense]|uniref:Serine protease n=1 Tax=Longimycelium tulufanense TaxID=907463 RepID=A0A8J3FXU9_9PSEU|nr:serpin family protein [Longimycelium tulufanense]GGM82886.1 serine protease [Longimycelium tulufanense]